MVCPLPSSSFQSRRAGASEQVHGNALFGVTVNIPRSKNVYTVVGVSFTTVSWTDMTSTAAARFADSQWSSVNAAAATDVRDETLVRAAQDGDRPAFGELYHRYVRMV